MALNTITATFDIPQAIVEGLTSGRFERVGGVIREADGKKIVGWLREIDGLDINAVSDSPLLGMSTTAASASMLNLGVSMMGFTAVLNKLQQIEQQLLQTQVVLEKLNQKIDLSFYANFKAAVSMAKLAFMADNQENRKSLPYRRLTDF